MGDNKTPKWLTIIKSCPAVGFHSVREHSRVDLPKDLGRARDSGERTRRIQPASPAGRSRRGRGSRGRWADAAYVEDPGVALLVVTEFVGRPLHVGALDLGNAVGASGPDLTQQGFVVQDPIGALRNSAQKLILGHLQLERAVTRRWA